MTYDPGTEAARLDIALVCMPIVAAERPSLALGQLQTGLSDAGISARSYFPSLMFLDYVGVEDFALFDLARIDDCLGDWLFSQVAFPDFEADDNRYIDRLLARNKPLEDQIGDNPHARLNRLRALMPEFVNWAASTTLAENPRIVGATSTFQQHVASLALLRVIRERAPDVVTMMGGANCETVMGRATHQRYPWVDYVVSGEADALISTLCTGILDRGRDLPAKDMPFGVLGPVHRSEGYPTVAAGDGVPRAVSADMAKIPLPDYDDYFQALSQSLNRDIIHPGLPVETARGCWWGERQHCTFCGLNGGSMKFRAKPVDVVLSDFAQLAEKHGFARFEAVDNIMAADFLDTLVPALEGLDYDVFYETKANLKPHEVEALGKAGIRWIQPGIENLDTRVLKLMRKGVTAWNNVRLLRSCRQYGVRVSWSLLCGFPGEEDAWFSEMAEFMPALSHFQPSGFAMLRFDRYSPYFDNPEEHGLDLVPSELYSYVYPHTEEELAEQVYFFEDRALGDRGRGMIRNDHTYGPGLEAVRARLREWHDAWKAEPPLVEQIDDGTTLSITDTRPAATAAEHRIDGVGRAVLLGTVDAPPRHRLIETLRTDGYAVSDIETALADLNTRMLTLEIDGRVISLTLQSPHTPLLASWRFPGGFLNKNAEHRKTGSSAAA
ncbi:MAG: RiPP maturation radical SAM protein 1 [Rhodospirillaceae bacterium]|jgi:ribosomal peptide maturation radical SAM protein 1|nr:RiPP maturation radical SAM protein 1 [Rhodospirillaceae bacterium]MBT3932188.1 RiPP maturation radical SAM protein 1 [Rhodospirillaceae bacterium]MBT4773372.1 RiPP maturation radical SAM protein 1 [Rhodospirillaceae bacterium]MBT5359970.1 RiPP maturation radical SAM protein 1 [Rhodospirillaceae bacterium]MBT5769811.1 RiPP maturation radical SAM protein 1 [Rhodospirillaceae bacterium]